MRRAVTVAGVAAVALAAGVAAAEEEAKQAPTEESLRETVVRWQRDLFAEDAKVRLATVDAMWPSAKDAAALFPEQGEKLGRFLEAVKKQAKKRLEAASAEGLAQQRERVKGIRKVRTIDVRDNDPSGSHEEVLKIIPKEVPVYRVVIEFEKRSAGSSSYLFVNDHWVHFQNFAAMPGVLPKLDELLERVGGGE